MKLGLYGVALVLFACLIAFGFSKVQACKCFSLTDPSVSAPGYSTSEDNYDVNFYFLDLEITNQSTFIKGNTLIGLKRNISRLDTFTCELSYQLSVDSVFIDGGKLTDFVHQDNLVRIAVPDDLATNLQMGVRIYYQGTAGSGGFFSGISSKTDNRSGQKITYTLSEPFQAKDWFPVKQNLADKADSVWVFVTTDSSLKAGSNGLLKNVTELENGKHRFEWKSAFPVSYYLISLSVGSYIDYSFYAKIGQTDSVLVQNFIYSAPGILESDKAIIDQTGPLITLFSEKFGPYPFASEKYGHCMAPLGGGMEHQTMTSISGFDFGIIAHELAHQWFGDYVTCGTWRDIWINEGFASYAEYIALENLKGNKQAIAWLDEAHNYAINYPSGNVYLTESEWTSVPRMFNYSLTYKKGGSIIHMLRYEIDNDSLFFEGLRDYLKDFSLSTATGKNFEEVFEDKTGKDLAWFFDQWYYGKGHPQFLTSWRQTSDSLYLTVSQTNSAGENKVFKTHLDYRVGYDNGSFEDFRVFCENPATVYHLPVKGMVQTLQMDPSSSVLKTSVIYRFVEQKVFTVKPNPFRSELSVIFRNNLAEHNITISGLNGKIYTSRYSTSGSIVLDLSFLPSGIYLLNVSENGNVYTEKIVRQ
jgi:aminopeptidase N